MAPSAEPRRSDAAAAAAAGRLRGRCAEADRAALRGPQPSGVAAVGPTDDATPMMPEVAQGVGVCWVDPAAPWLGARSAGPLAAGRPRRRGRGPGPPALRRGEGRPRGRRGVRGGAPPTDRHRRSRCGRRRRLRRAGPAARPHPGRSATCCPTRRSGPKTFWSTLEKDLVAHLARSRTMEIFANRQLKLYSRAGETKDDFTARCREAAATKADEEAAKLRDKYETKAGSLQERLQAAQDRADVLAAEASGRQQEELLSTAGSILGSFLGGRTRAAPAWPADLRSAAGRRSRSRAASERLDAAQNKVGHHRRAARPSWRTSSAGGHAAHHLGVGGEGRRRSTPCR